MNSSGIKRGLAVTAVSAFALAGLAIAPAQAFTTINLGEPGLELYSGYSTDSSTRNDGVNQTVTLLAGTPTVIGSTVNAIRFSYLKGATAVPIADVAVVNGVATMQWTPPAPGAELTAITGVRAEALDIGAAVLATDDNTGMIGANFPTNPVTRLTNGALRAPIGVGPDQEVVVTGVTNDLAGVFPVEAQNLGPVDTGASIPGTATGVPDGNNLTPWAAVVPVTNANLGPSAADDEIVIGSKNSNRGDDTSVYTAYLQAVTAASAPLAPGSTVNVQAGAPLTDTKYDITVTDQFAKPIQGQDVYESNSAGAAFNGNGTPAAGGETNTAGIFQATLNEATMDNGTDANPAANIQSTFYVVDVNQNGTYQNGVDYKFEVSQSQYASVPATVTITSSKGAAIDDDETTVVTLLVKDQNGNPIQGVVPVVKLTAVNTDANPDVTTVTAPVPAATGADGKTTINVSGVNNTTVNYTVDAYVNNNGTPQPDAGDAIATPFAIASDNSYIKWDTGTNAQALNGTTTVQSGKFLLAETDTVLPGRNVSITYSPTGNSILALQAQQPAGTVRGGDTVASAVTDATGSFAVAVTDPAVPNGQELNNTLTATNAALGITGNTGTDDLSGSDDFLGDLQALDLDFLRSLTPTRVEIDNTITNDQTDGLEALINFPNDPMPGGLAIAEVSSFNADNVQLDDVDINMTIDEGYFLDLANPFEGTPAVGGLLDFRSAGQTATVSTDDGVGTMIVNIERNAGFDDDGLVSDKLHATAGSATDDHDFTWSTNQDPLNQGSFDVALSADQESSILPKARAGTGNSGQVVDYDVTTTDQFGNRTSQPTTTTDNSPIAAFSSTGASEFDLNQPAIEAFSNSATNQSLEVELNGAQKTAYTDDPGDSSFDPANPFVFFASVPQDIQTTTDAINWYNLNFATSTFSLDQEGPETVPVGTTVTEVLTATDQEGQALNGIGVGFIRVGPESNNDSDGNNSDTTDVNGQAFYDYAGSIPGTGSTSAVVYSDAGVRQFKIGPDTVTFGSAVAAIHPKLIGESSHGRDILRVSAQKAHGAQVRLYKKTAHGKVLLMTAHLDENGVKSFSVKDKNGRGKTKYFAKVSNTPRTQKGTSNTVNMR